MDNLCHTLAGAAFAHAGLKRTTRLGSATLMIAANLPDVDVLVFATDLPSVAFRRGWTHGVLAQALLPLLLAALMFCAGRIRKRAAAAQPSTSAADCDFRWLLLLSYVGVISHVALDLLNNYGVRLLMPFSGRWWYGDAVFIIDIWLWLMLGAGVWHAMTRDNVRGARLALTAAAVYIVVLAMSAGASRELVLEQWRLQYRSRPATLMVGPLPLTPFARTVIVDAGTAYATGTFTWFSRETRFDKDLVPKNDNHPAVREAVATNPGIRAVLTWARFPYYRIESTPGGDVVTLRDMRFGDRVGGVSALVPRVPRAPAGQ